MSRCPRLRNEAVACESRIATAKPIRKRQSSDSRDEFGRSKCCRTCQKDGAENINPPFNAIAGVLDEFPDVKDMFAGANLKDATPLGYRAKHMRTLAAQCRELRPLPGAPAAAAGCAGGARFPSTRTLVGSATTAAPRSADTLCSFAGATTELMPSGLSGESSMASAGQVTHDLSPTYAAADFLRFMTKVARGMLHWLSTAVHWSPSQSFSGRDTEAAPRRSTAQSLPTVVSRSPSSRCR